MCFSVSHWLMVIFLETQTHPRRNTRERKKKNTLFKIIMSHLLLKWLNEECRLSRTVYSIEDDFKNGYLFGELLDRFGLQPNFKKRFRDTNTAKAKLVNFCELEKSLRKVDIEMNSDTYSSSSATLERRQESEERMKCSVRV